MECPKCRQYNLPGSSFCEKCGNNLKLAQRQPPHPGRSYEGPGAGYGYGGYSAGPAARPTPAPPPSPSYPAPPSQGPPSQASPAPSSQGYPSPPAHGYPSPPARGGPSVPATPVPAPPSARVPASPRTPVTPSPQVPAPPRPPAEPPPFGVLRSLAQGRDGRDGIELPLRWDRNLVGRLSEADNIQPQVDLSQIGEGGVSRRHAQIVREDGLTHLEDLGSANGTFINGVQLQPGLQHPLKDQDEVRFGSLRFQYRQTR